MHGKITRYTATTGSGVIMNASKKIFELKKESWHDGRNRPAVGMYVEFRTGDNGIQVTDARASKYQEFPPDALIREIDFWKSNTDEELKNKEAELRAREIQKIFAQTNYLKIQEIELDRSVQDCIKEYFALELKSVEFLQELDIASLAPIIDFSICKRFLNKALDHLIFSDRKLNIDMFAEFHGRLGTLEYSHTFFSKNDVNPQRVFEEAFLEYQLHYKGAIRASSGIKERIMQLQNKIRTTAHDIKVIYKRIEAKKGDENELKEKMARMRANSDKAHEEVKTLTSASENLDNLCKAFSEKNLKIFEAVFRKTMNMLREKTEEALNVTATQLDNQIWELGMKSVSIRNVFFKHNINEPYCMMTFLGQTIKKLDKGKITAANEQAMYRYYTSHQLKYVKRFLILTNQAKVEISVKIDIMSQSKNNNVVIAKKDSEFFREINKTKFQEILIDPTGLDKNAISRLLADTKESKHNQDSNIILLTKEQISQMKE
ncbi:hypothetical protein LS73_005210 [Helicobacter muridarum]|uniref:Uncharacterized protein n=1 Tax=Helicobacter muridarum TaxID=216 RepID=A0A099U0F0_9HELI|nr:hypothetical protein [Helicobacter muridarum]TLE00205.1 hypothetical protein LS73_005210 [Helicobacter muridarum]STQ85689.1 Uncharacterised protein [Helicobacter muridarum]